LGPKAQSLVVGNYVFGRVAIQNGCHTEETLETHFCPKLKNCESEISRAARFVFQTQYLSKPTKLLYSVQIFGA